MLYIIVQNACCPLSSISPDLHRAIKPTRDQQTKLIAVVQISLHAHVWHMCVRERERVKLYSYTSCTKT